MSIGEDCLHGEAMKNFADGLKQNRVSSFDNQVIFYILIYFFQSITTLTLLNDLIGDDEVEFLGEAIGLNQVRLIRHS